MEYQSIKNTSKKIKQLLANNKLKEAIDDLIDYADLTENKEFRNSLILKNSNYVYLKNQEINNISDKIELERNKLTSSLLQITDEIEEGLMSGLTDRELVSLTHNDKVKFNNSNWISLELASEELQLNTNHLFFLETYNRQIHFWNLKEAEIQEERTAYINWMKTKRKFDSNEITEGSWIKVTRNGEGSILKLNNDNSIVEYSIHNPSRTWGGEWNLEEGILIMNINFEHWEFQQTVIANREVMNHSGYEIALNSRDQSLHYFQMLLIKNRNNLW